MRFALGVEYEGTNYYGWQQQEFVTSVQREVENALSLVADHAISVVCAGRTDKGVHAVGQVIHFNTTSEREPSAWVLGTNSHLPADIRINWAQSVSVDFHARYSALARTYVYLIHNARLRPCLARHYMMWYPQPLDVDAMQLAANHLLGEQDFTSFRAVGCQSNSPMRNVTEVELTRRSDNVIVKITANAFLHHMVRNIVGSLCVVGSATRTPSWIKEVIAAKDRTVAAETAAASGLYLLAVQYPDKFSLPTSVIPEMLKI